MTLRRHHIFQSAVLVLVVICLRGIPLHLQRGGERGVTLAIHKLRNGRHRHQPGRPASTLLHATVRQKRFRFTTALAGLKWPFFLYTRIKAATRKTAFSRGTHSLAKSTNIY